MDQIVTPTQARKDLFKIIKRINENNEPVVIKPTKADEKSVVVIGEDDWKAIQETLFLVKRYFWLITVLTSKLMNGKTSRSTTLMMFGVNYELRDQTQAER